MSLSAVTKRYWIFETWFGGFVEVSRAKHPELIEARVVARRLIKGG